MATTKLKEFQETLLTHNSISELHGILKRYDTHMVYLRFTTEDKAEIIRELNTAGYYMKDGSFISNETILALDGQETGKFILKVYDNHTVDCYKYFFPFGVRLGDTPEIYYDKWINSEPYGVLVSAV